MCNLVWLPISQIRPRVSQTWLATFGLGRVATNLVAARSSLPPFFFVARMDLAAVGWTWASPNQIWPGEGWGNARSSPHSKKTPARSLSHSTSLNYPCTSLHPRSSSWVIAFLNLRTIHCGLFVANHLFHPTLNDTLGMDPCIDTTSYEGATTAATQSMCSSGHDSLNLSLTAHVASSLAPPNPRGDRGGGGGRRSCRWTQRRGRP